MKLHQFPFDAVVVEIFAAEVVVESLAHDAVANPSLSGKLSPDLAHVPDVAEFLTAVVPKFAVVDVVEPFVERLAVVGTNAVATVDAAELAPVDMFAAVATRSNL